MTPKDKAQDLFVTFMERYPDGVFSDHAAKVEAKFGALFVADSCLSVIDYTTHPIVYDFWEAVKKEIELL